MTFVAAMRLSQLFIASGHVEDVVDDLEQDAQLVGKTAVRDCLRFTQSAEDQYDADAGGAAIAGRPDGLVSALRKIEARSKVVPMDANPATAHMFIIKPFSGRGLVSLFSTHPPTEQRIAALLGERR